MNRTKLLLRTIALFLGAALAAIGLWRGILGPGKPSLEDGDFGTVADFRLTDQEGRPVGLEDLKGRVWVADFIFTRCMGPCPVISRAMARVAKAAGPDARFVSFTVDPGHDSPPVLKDYAERFGADPARWSFLTGDTQAVRDLVMGSFKSALQENAGAPPGEAVTHSLHFVLVDKTGRIRGYFTGTDEAALGRLVRRVEALSR